MHDALLDAVIDRIIPADADPGALDLGTPNYVRNHLGQAAADAQLIRDGLATLGDRFLALDAAGRDQALLAIENEPWFQRLVTLTAEGFYADPDNGGNANARSWGMIGYEHRLPEGPSGPARRQS